MGSKAAVARIEVCLTSLELTRDDLPKLATWAEEDIPEGPVVFALTDAHTGVVRLRNGACTKRVFWQTSMVGSIR